MYKKLIYFFLKILYYTFESMNQQTLNYAHEYFETFCGLFEVTSEGNLNTNQENLLRIQEWFNRSYLLISILIGVPLTPLSFNLDIGDEADENQKILMHIYSVAYTSLHHFSRILNKLKLI